MIADAAPPPRELPFSASEREWVRVAPFRERFEQLRECRSGPLYWELTNEELATEVAHACGWTDARANGTFHADSTRVLRTVGLKEDKGRYRERMSLQTAEALCGALGLDPFEVGI